LVLCSRDIFAWYVWADDAVHHYPKLRRPVDLLSSVAARLLPPWNPLWLPETKHHLAGCRSERWWFTLWQIAI